jgi:tripartite-type tricarboxylate transporter receptor subunit TctC
MAGINIVPVPFNAGSQQYTALLSGEVHMLVSDAGLLMPLAKSGRVRPLAVTSAQPSEMAPGLPAVTAAGLPGYEWVGMTGGFAPAKTPATIINRLNQDFVRFLRTAEAKEAFAKLGTEVADSSPEQFAALIRSDRAKTTKMIQDGAVKVGP